MGGKAGCTGCLTDNVRVFAKAGGLLITQPRFLQMFLPAFKTYRFFGVTLYKTAY
jgi:hypothetical protein